MKFLRAIGAVSIAAALTVGVLSSQNSRQVIPGSPLAGITAHESELFRLGFDDFIEVETADETLGPVFNGTGCASCHSVPAIGGVTAMTEIRAGHRDENGKFTELNGGTLFHLFSTSPHRCQVQIPLEANVIARRAPLPIFGDGLIEAIPDETIAALADPDDVNGDGISGRAAWINEVGLNQRRVGRFGWKAQHATLFAFGADAYTNEMGITNDLFPTIQALGITQEQLDLCSPPRRGNEDPVDRRTGMRAIDNFANFMRLLAPIDRGPIDDQVKHGERLFSSIGCASCHTPEMTTGRNANPLFDRQPVKLYSDLLLHDVGTGDGIPQGAAEADEVRTPPLWGLRLRRPLMHDGASTLTQSIERHAGEATFVIERYKELGDADKAALISFLDSL